jgi:hypothetical protein
MSIATQYIYRTLLSYLRSTDAASCLLKCLLWHPFFFSLLCIHSLFVHVYVLSLQRLISLVMSYRCLGTINDCRIRQSEMQMQTLGYFHLFSTRRTIFVLHTHTEWKVNKKTDQSWLVHEMELCNYGSSISQTVSSAEWAKHHLSLCSMQCHDYFYCNEEHVTSSTRYMKQFGIFTGATCSITMSYNN